MFWVTDIDYAVLVERSRAGRKGAQVSGIQVHRLPARCGVISYSTLQGASCRIRTGGESIDAQSRHLKPAFSRRRQQSKLLGSFPFVPLTGVRPAARKDAVVCRRSWHPL